MATSALRHWYHAAVSMHHYCQAGCYSRSAEPSLSALLTRGSRDSLAGAYHESLSTDNVSLLRLDPHRLPVWVLHNGVGEQVLREELAHIIMQRQLSNQIPCPAQKDFPVRGEDSREPDRAQFQNAMPLRAAHCYMDLHIDCSLQRLRA